MAVPPRNGTTQGLRTPIVKTSLAAAATVVAVGTSTGGARPVPTTTFTSARRKGAARGTSVATAVARVGAACISPSNGLVVVPRGTASKGLTRPGHGSVASRMASTIADATGIVSSIPVASQGTVRATSTASGATGDVGHATCGTPRPAIPPPGLTSAARTGGHGTVSPSRHVGPSSSTVRRPPCLAGPATTTSPPTTARASITPSRRTTTVGPTSPRSPTDGVVTTGRPKASVSVDGGLTTVRLTGVGVKNVAFTIEAVRPRTAGIIV